MHPQLRQVEQELHDATARLRALEATAPAARWFERPAPERWSIAECVAHLSLTSRAFLPLLDAALAEARASGRPAPRRYRRDLAGWLLARSVEPPARVRVATAAAFVPHASRPVPELVEEFAGLQEELATRVRAADGLPVHGVKLVSPFNASVRYSAWSAFTIITAHERRHLWQAEETWRALH